eukprot:TRINITY_DN22704_c0_g1_i2.p1 TRINITY_DN22704_c0_g1~~TRINITY_DN22704_c0_g1_i2.p1  ORF type:complete len:218 (+),score=38.79 TRINITY_DN22704_c0_g1_i2:95-748(+)
MLNCVVFFFFLMIRRPPRSTQGVSSAASDVYKRQEELCRKCGFINRVRQDVLSPSKIILYMYKKMYIIFIKCQQSQQGGIIVINKVKLFGIMVVLLIGVFLTTYFCMDRFYTKKNVEPNVATQNTIDKNDALKDKVKISLFSGGKKEKEYTLEEIKDKLNIKEDLKESELIKLLKKEGYSLDVASNNELMFKKDNSNLLEANKYYIGEKKIFGNIQN